MTPQKHVSPFRARLKPGVTTLRCDLFCTRSMSLSDEQAPDAILLLPHLQNLDARPRWRAIADRIGLEAMPHDCDVTHDRYRLTVSEIDLNTDLPFTSASTNSAFVWTRPSE